MFRKKYIKVEGHVLIKGGTNKKNHSEANKNSTSPTYLKIQSGKAFFQSEKFTDTMTVWYFVIFINYVRLFCLHIIVNSMEFHATCIQVRGWLSIEPGSIYHILSKEYVCSFSFVRCASANDFSNFIKDIPFLKMLL